MIPQPKSNEVIDLIRAIFHDRRHDEFKLAGIAREGRKLISTNADPATGHMVLGTLAALQFNSEEFIQHYLNTFRLSPDRNFRTNYIVVAKRLGLYEEALAAGKDMYVRYPDDLEALKCSLSIAMETMAWDFAKDIERRLAKLGCNTNYLAIPVSRFDLTAAMMKELNVGHQDLLARLSVASAVIREAGEPQFGTIFDVSPEGTVSYEIAVKADIDQRVDLNIAIADQIIDKFESTLAEIVTFSCVISRDAVKPDRLSDLSAEAK